RHIDGFKLSSAFHEALFSTPGPNQRRDSLAYVSVPKDLTRVKSKVIFNLTRRQIVCFGGGALIGVPLFFWLRPGLGSSPAAICMMLTMLPFLLLGLYENNGRPLEKVL